MRFAGLRSLLDVTLDLQPFTVLVGPNGCGKSTLLDEIQRLCACTWPAKNENSNLGAVFAVIAQENPDLLETAGRDLPKVWQGRAATGAEYRLQIGPASQGGIPLQRAKVLLKPTEQTPLVDLASRAANDPNLRVMLNQLSWRAQRLALVPKQIAAPSGVNLTELQPDGYGIPTILKDLAGNHTQAFLQLQADLRAVVPCFRELRFSKQEAVGPDGQRAPLTGLELVMVQGRVPANRVSDGTLLALALLTAAHNPDMPDLLLMDDIDHGLHLGAQLELLKAIRTIMARRPGLQIVCTTHSPYFLHAVSVEEVRVMALNAEGHTVVRPLAAHPDIAQWRTAMTAGELWANLGEEWLLDG